MAILEDLIRAIELWLRIAKEQVPLVDPTLDPVLLVPGIAGSILEAVDDAGNKERVWVRILAAEHEFRDKLWSKFDASTGKTVSVNKKTSIVVPEDRYGLYAIDTLDPDMVKHYFIYYPEVEMIKWGYQEGKTLFGFGYDFRQSNRLSETLDRFSKKLESVFEKYVKSWIAIAAPFQGNNKIFIWREKLDDNGKKNALLESYEPAEAIQMIEEALSKHEIISNGMHIPLPLNEDILKWAKETHDIICKTKLPESVKFYNIYGIDYDTPHTVCYGSEHHPISNISHLLHAQGKYVYVDGDGSVPTESAKADGLNAVARVGVAADHRGIICNHQVFRIVQHWLHAGEPDPFYDPLTDYVILPTILEFEKYCEKHGYRKSVWEDWEIISPKDKEIIRSAELPPMVSMLSASREGKEGSREEVQAAVIIHPEKKGRQHVEVRAVGVSHGA
ncbi:hypothetical protein PR202_ga19056 [Eleusine coracana subsp. coracana]|uniref:Uncharacterized protein n=1 Tax=Eleusine coracana subsp. coracana TaxID=191504 RepID=A0AAV5CV80_ELECO|nr:hypothetical protein PR202_ga19056 [Eleusine coracana subsp. coracana]